MQPLHVITGLHSGVQARMTMTHVNFVVSAASAATIVDTVGSAALVTMSLKSGVSLSISVNYISAMPGGEDAEVDARVVKVHSSDARATCCCEDRLYAQGYVCNAFLTVTCVNQGMTHW